MHTGTLIEELVKLELRSWSYYGRARVTIRDTDVAHLLDPYELRPRQMKIAGRNRRGYTLEDVTAAIDRYAPYFLPRRPQKPATPLPTPKSLSVLRLSEVAGPLLPRCYPLPTALKQQLPRTR